MLTQTSPSSVDHHGDMRGPGRHLAEQETPR